MAYAKKSRRHQASAGLRVTGLPVMFIGRLVITGLLLMSVVLFTVMGLLFNKKTAADVANCPCLEQADPELTSNSERQLPSNSERQSPSNSERQSPSNSERRLVSNSERQLASNSERQLASATQDSGWGGDIVRLKVTSAPLVDNVTTASERNQEISTDANPNKFKPGWWFSHTRHACKMLGLSTDKQNLKPYMMSKVLVDEKHKILFCQMAKVASTNLGKIFAIIAGKFNGTNPEAIPTKDVHGMYNKLQIHLNAFPRDAMLDKLTRYYKFVFVRDPFERLLSGYRDKFLEPKNATQTGGVTFPEFVTYLVDKERKVKMDGHRQPMYQLCRPCETSYDFIGKINTLGEDISHILKVNNLSGLVDVPTQPSSHSFHKTDLFLGQFYSQILFCQLAKVASTNMGKIFAIIAGKFNGTNPEAIESNDVHGMYNKLQIHLNAFPRDAMLDKLTRYYKFVFVRDPFERLLSGYRNKFLKPSSSYFTYLNKRIVLKYRKNATQTGGVTFPEFVTYLVDKERKVPTNGHWQPMFELCRPCETSYDFIGKINTLGEDISHILKVNNLSGLVDVPKQSSSHSFHKTDLFLGQFYSQVPRPLLSLLHEMYYPDYAIFDFQIPIVIQKLLA